MSAQSFQVGDLVWAKMKGLAWPGRIIEPPINETSRKPKKDQHYVYFFGLDSFSWIMDDNIAPHTDSMLETAGKKRSAALRKAVEDLLNYSKSNAKKETSSTHKADEANCKVEKDFPKSKSPQSPNDAKKPVGKKVQLSRKVQVMKKPKTRPSVRKSDDNESSVSPKRNRLKNNADECSAVLASVPPDMVDFPVPPNDNDCCLHQSVSILDRPGYVERPPTPLLNIETVTTNNAKEDKLSTRKADETNSEVEKDFPKSKSPQIVNNDAKKRIGKKVQPSKKVKVIQPSKKVKVMKTRKTRPSVRESDDDESSVSPKRSRLNNADEYSAVLASAPPDIIHSPIPPSDNVCLLRQSFSILDRPGYVERPPTPLLNIETVTTNNVKKDKSSTRKADETNSEVEKDFPKSKSPQIVNNDAKKRIGKKVQPSKKVKVIQPSKKVKVIQPSKKVKVMKTRKTRPSVRESDDDESSVSPKRSRLNNADEYSAVLASAPPDIIHSPIPPSDNVCLLRQSFSILDRPGYVERPPTPLLNIETVTTNNAKKDKSSTRKADETNSEVEKEFPKSKSPQIVNNDEKKRIGKKVQPSKKVKVIQPFKKVKVIKIRKTRPSVRESDDDESSVSPKRSRLNNADEYSAVLASAPPDIIHSSIPPSDNVCRLRQSFSILDRPGYVERPPTPLLNIETVTTNNAKKDKSSTRKADETNSQVEKDFYRSKSPQIVNNDEKKRIGKKVQPSKKVKVIQPFKKVKVIKIRKTRPSVRESDDDESSVSPKRSRLNNADEYSAVLASAPPDIIHSPIPPSGNVCRLRQSFSILDRPGYVERPPTPLPNIEIVTTNNAKKDKSSTRKADETNSEVEKDFYRSKSPQIVNNDEKKRIGKKVQPSKKAKVIQPFKNVKVIKIRKTRPSVRESDDDESSVSPKRSRLNNADEYSAVLASAPPDIIHSPIPPSDNACRLRQSFSILDRPGYVERPPTPPLDFESVSETLKIKNIKPTDKKIGFLGLGKIGQRIVKNLLHSGHQVTVWNRTPEKVENFVKAGAQRGVTPGDVFAACDITFSCVSDVEAAKVLIFGGNGILEALEKCGVEGKGYVEMTSMDPETSRYVAGAITSYKGKYLEAPIIGSRTEAEEGTLFVLAAGDKSLFTACETCFHAMGSHAYFLSNGIPEGSVMKLVISMLRGTIYGALSEAMALVEKAKLSQEDFLRFLSLTSLNSEAVLEKGSCMRFGKFSANTSLKYAHNDMKLALTMAHNLEQPMPVAAAANEVYNHAKLLGYKDHDVSAVYMGAKY